MTEDKSKTDITETKHNPEKANNTKHSKTKLPWFSRLLRHSARRRGWLILRCSALSPHSFWLIDWAGFNVSTNTVYIIWETVLQVKRPNQQYQSTEGRNATKVRKTQKSKQHKIQQHNKETHIQKHSKYP